MSDEPEQPATDPAPENPAEQGSGEPEGRWVSTDEAAQHLGISVRTVNRRAIDGTLKSRQKTGSHGREIWIEGQPVTETAESSPSEQPEQGSDGAPTTSALAHLSADVLYPFADVIEHQSQRIEQLAAEAAMWKERARQYEAQLQALPAGEPVATWRPWWKRFLGID